MASAIIQPIRQRLNQWNWRKKTALVTALAITAAGTFAYHQRAQAAAVLAWPAVFKGDFLVKLFISIGVSQAVNAAITTKVKKTANADTEHWCYDRREHHLTFKENGAWRSDGENYTRTVHAVATADEGPSHDTSGTDSYLLELGYSSDALTKSEVFYQEVNDNANLSGATIIYDVEELVDGEWDTLETGYDSRKGTSDYWLYVTYGGYFPNPPMPNCKNNWTTTAPIGTTWPRQTAECPPAKWGLCASASKSAAPKKPLCATKPSSFGQSSVLTEFPETPPPAPTNSKNRATAQPTPPASDTKPTKPATAAASLQGRLEMMNLSLNILSRSLTKTTTSCRLTSPKSNGTTSNSSVIQLGSELPLVTSNIRKFINGA